MRSRNNRLKRIRSAMERRSADSASKSTTDAEITELLKPLDEDGIRTLVSNAMLGFSALAVEAMGLSQMRDEAVNALTNGHDDAWEKVDAFLSAVDSAEMPTDEELRKFKVERDAEIRRCAALQESW